MKMFNSLVKLREGIGLELGGHHSREKEGSCYRTITRAGTSRF